MTRTVSLILRWSRRKRRWREKSARESPNGIIYRTTPHLSQSARVARAAICTRVTFGYSRFACASICTCVMFRYSQVPIWDIDSPGFATFDILKGNSGVSEHHTRANRSTCKSGVSESRTRANSCTCNTCTLGQVRSGLVYYTVWRLPSTLFLFPCSSHLYASFLILTLRHLTFRQCVVDCI